jgi:hypothetical protein
MNSDGRDFRLKLSFTSPHTGQFRDPSGTDSELLQRINQNLFNGTDIRADIALPLAKVDDGVADDLAGAVVSDIAAAIRVVQFNVLLPQDGFRREEVFAAPVAPDGDDVRVLNEEQMILTEAFLALGGDAVLNSESFGVGHAPEIAEGAASGGSQRQPGIRH